jgi:tryptophan synthase alpha chain
MTPSRIDDAFARIRKNGRGGLVTYLTAGDPSPARSADLLRAVADAGADVLEVGVPFSDPLADGPAIQRATERALAQGMTLRGTLDIVRRTRASIDAPMVLFTYANPILRMGAEPFAREAADAGVDGVLVLDYPLEESEPLRQPIVDAGLDPIFLVSPTTTDERIRRSAELGRGFLYLISRLGVTGVRDAFDNGVEGVATRVKKSSRLPVAVGFGISTPEHVKHACALADAAVVGSALVQVVAEHGQNPDVAQRAGDYVRWLKSAL